MRKILTLLLLSGLLNTAFTQNVGIGTTSPQAKLDIIGKSSDAFPLLKVGVTGSSNPYFVIEATSGYVGIGTANPSQPLDINGSLSFSGAFMPGGSAGNAGQVLVSQGAGAPPQWQNASVFGDNWGSQVAQTQSPIIGDGTATNPIKLQNGSSAGDLLIWNGSQWSIQQPGASSGIAPLCNSPSVNYVQKWTGTELCNSLIFDNGTGVGIGTTSPTALLELSGGGLEFRDSFGIGWWSIPPYNSGNVTADAARIYFSIGNGTYWGASSPYNDFLIIEKTDGGTANPDGGILFVNRGNTGSPQVAMAIRGDGNVGVGLINPATKLDVNGYVRARTGYGDWIEIGGDASGNDVEIQVSVPASRDWVTFWNTTTSQVSNIRVGKINLHNALMPSGSAGNPGQVLESRGPNLAPVWRSLGSRVHFTSSTTSTTTSPTTLTLTLTGLNGGEKIVVFGDGWANGGSGGRVEVRIKHNGNQVAFRRYSVHDYGIGFNNADFSLSIVTVVTATAGTNTIQLELKRVGGGVSFKDRSLTAIVF
ncbi:MAG: hypothetical protein GXO48_06000 [Chlorobi bacterium]|nr:hypothetical protein [Chlorobiota bacterium]